MNWENTFYPFSITDTANCKGFVNSMSPTANNYPCEDLDTFFIAFDHLRMNIHGVAYLKRNRILSIISGLDFIKQCTTHKF